MSLLSLSGVELSYGARPILTDLNLLISANDRVGLCGPNGSGKTTLLRVISGKQSVDKGVVDSSRGVDIGYLTQELDAASDTPLSDYVVNSVRGRESLSEELEQLEAALERASERGDENAMIEHGERLAELHEKVEHYRQYYSEHEARRILTGLGFVETDFARPLSEFSGGWQMRAVLTALLFQKPSLLLLDEPTNHLDMPSVAWFSSFLKRYSGAFILISHDRDFLNEQINRVVSFEPEGIRQYRGNYDRYIAQRTEERIILESQAKNLAREREHMEKFINRFRAQANKAAAVQSRVKALEKMGDVQLLQDRRVARFRFPPTERPVNEVIRLENVAKSFGELEVFKGVDATVERGARIGIIGENGAGKTTLLKIIAGALRSDAGKVTLGSKVHLAYYAQHQAEALSPELTVYEEVLSSSPAESPNRVRSILGAFLFSGDDVDKSIKVLSGGERARVALAKLMIRPGNVMIMDEPSNHLDLETTEALTESLKTYDGTLIFVSHNRTLVRELATTIWSMEAGVLEVYGGSLDEYMYSCEQRRQLSGGPEGSAQGAKSEAPKKRTREQEKQRKRLEAEQRNKRSKVLRPLERQVEKLEARIAVLEGEQAERSSLLADPDVYADAERSKKLLVIFQTAQADLGRLSGEWEQTLEKVEELKAELESEAPQ